MVKEFLGKEGFQANVNIARTSYKKDMIFIGLLLAIAISLMFANFWWVSQQDKNDREYVSLSGELKIISQSLATEALKATQGNKIAFAELQNDKTRFNDILKTLKEGNSAGLSPTIKEIKEKELLSLEEVWYPIGNNIDVILRREDPLLQLIHYQNGITDIIPKIEKDILTSLTTLSGQPEKTKQAYFLGQMLWLNEKIKGDIEKITETTGDPTQVGNAFKEHVNLFKNNIQLLTDNINSSPKSTDNLMSQIQDIQPYIKVIVDPLEDITKKSEDFMLIKNAASEINIGTETLLEKAKNLTVAYSNSAQGRIIGTVSGYLLGGVGLMLLGWLAYRAWEDAKVNLALSAAQNKGNQVAILRLLDELSDLADGDLTVRATVSDDITGAIASSVNYAIDALRKLVFTINETTNQVFVAAQEAQGTSTALAEASELQAREIIGATAAINAIAAAIEHVSTNANESTKVATESVKIANNGVAVVQNTTASMERIREQIQETSKRIKRLGESSQEIGDTVSIIDDIADQTNILALNAAIQAAMAGESGRGFAVVADEVQRLAERSSEATRQIDGLVKAIQTDTNEAVSSMEQSTLEVVQGAKKAQDAGVALEKIENVSNHLAELIKNISNASQQQASASGKISNTMVVIQEITTKTALGTTQTASSIGNLSNLAVDLRNSVSGFNLPLEIS